MAAEDLFPRSRRYDLDWVLANQMGPNVLWLTESLTNVLELRPGSRVLDLGCGRALSSIFLAREFDVQVWAADLWISPTENLERIRAAGLEDRVFPLRVEAHALPFAEDFFDAVVSMDAYHYFGTDVHYLEFHLLKHAKRGGTIGIVSPASRVEIPAPAPAYINERYNWMNSVAWWRRHWERAPGLAVEHAEALPAGWEQWLRFHELDAAAKVRTAPQEEHRDLIEDAGRYLSFVRMVGRRTA
jgi:SAM-dependent methyltransferase